MKISWRLIFRVLALVLAVVAGKLIFDYGVGNFFTWVLDFVSEHSTFFIAVYMLFVAFVIFVEGQNPDKTLLWLILVIALPVVGFIAYILFGPDLKNLKRRRELKAHREKLRQISPCARHLPCETRLSTLLLNDANAEMTRRNRMETLIDGDETFGAIKQKLSLAKKYINMEYYAIFDDGIGNEIADILIDRARAGVAVRVIYDDVGSWSLTRKYVERLRSAGAKVHAFMPVVFAMLRRGLNYRTHRKIIVIDGEVAFVGGLNIGDAYLGKCPKIGKWRDTHAQQRLWITTPYLVPGESLSYALSVAAESGVDVRIIYPKRSDNLLVQWASNFVANQMLRAGVRVYAYADGFVHAKTLLADDDIVSVGTTNLDIRSLEINFEVQAFVYSEEMNRAYAEQFLLDLQKCEERTIEGLARRTLPEKITEGFGRLWSSLL